MTIIKIIRKLGLQDTTMNLAKTTENEIGIKEIFIYTNDGTLLINSKFTKLIGIQAEKCT